GVAAVDKIPVREGAVGCGALGIESGRRNGLVQVGGPRELDAEIRDVGEAQAHTVGELAVDGESPLHHVGWMEIDLVRGAELKSPDGARADSGAGSARLRENENRLAVGSDVVEGAHVALNGSGQGEEDGAEQDHVVDSEVGADGGL